MILIFEGIDGSGKSTIIDAVSKQYGLIKFFHNDDNRKVPIHINTKDQMSSYYAGMNNALINVCYSFDNFIIDRFHISEGVYSEKRISYPSYSLINSELKKTKKQFIIIYCHCDYINYTNRLLRRGERIQLSKKDFEADDINFMGHINKSGFKHILLNTSNVSIEYTLNKFDEAIKKIRKL